MPNWFLHVQLDGQLHSYSFWRLYIYRMVWNLRTNWKYDADIVHNAVELYGGWNIHDFWNQSAAQHYWHSYAFWRIESTMN